MTTLREQRAIRRKVLDAISDKLDERNRHARDGGFYDGPPSLHARLYLAEEAIDAAWDKWGKEDVPGTIAQIVEAALQALAALEEYGLSEGTQP